MKTIALFIGCLIFSACVWAQDAPQAPPPMHHHDMGAMPDQHAAERKAQVEKMRATLNEMKANLAKEKKPSAVEQKNIELWEAMIGHMEEMANMMSHHDEMGMGMGHGEGHGMGCCAKMMDKEGGMKDGGCCGGGKCEKPKAAGE